MIRTLIVDDDYLVRTYLLAVTDWKKEGFEIVADVQDGEQALEKIEAFNPELVITDISMPVMDGIELIKEIRNRQLSCTIVVLSCHDEYNHVKEALKQGADDYILKNAFKNDNIFNILENLRNRIHKEREKKREKERILQLADLGSNELRKKFISNVINNDYSFDQLKQKSQSCGISLSLLKTAVLALRIMKPDNPIWILNEKKQEVFHGLIRICHDILGKEHPYEIIDERDYEYVIILDGSSITDISILHFLTNRLIITIEEKLNLSLVVGVSGICIGKESLKHAYLHAKQAVEDSFYKNNKIYYYESRHLPNTKKISFSRFYDDVRKLLIKVDIDAIIDLFRRQVACFEREYTKSEVVVAWVQEIDTILQVERENKVYEHITSINQVKQIIETYKDHIHYYPNISKKITNITVAQSIRHIIQNYEKDISLTSVAEVLKVNATYLSRIFKKETQMNFTDYLNTCRIQNARSLLSSTNKKVKDISKECGFYDYRYFCKIFKKMIGESPLAYRKKIDMTDL